MFRCNWVQHLILHNCQYLLHCAQCAKLCKVLTIWCIILELLCKIVKWHAARSVHNRYIYIYSSIYINRPHQRPPERLEQFDYFQRYPRLPQRPPERLGQFDYFQRHLKQPRVSKLLWESWNYPGCFRTKGHFPDVDALNEAVSVDGQGWMV